ncbi:MAG TPA: DUF87 domain-containing protein, partial [Chloroflexota bacterium]|nr:DUF87 domain-containing protein [Chloroflexota bacterium]
ESALTRLTRRLVGAADVLAEGELDVLREAPLDESQLTRVIAELADDIVASPAFAGQDLDINVVRALLYLQRGDPRIDQRVRQYLHGRQLTELSQGAVAALDPNADGRAFEIIEALGKVMWTVDRAALVFCIDQVEDLRFFDDPEERFQKAVRDLIQIANRLPTSMILISCLDDFYGQVRSVLAQSYVDRIEKAGPVALLETRTAEEARLIIAKRLEHEAETCPGCSTFPDPAAFFGPQFSEEFAGLSTRRLLEHAQSRLRARQPNSGEREPTEERAGFVSTLAAALGFGASNREAAADLALGIDYREAWQQFLQTCAAAVPSDDQELMDVLVAALGLVRDEWGGAIQLAVERLALGDDLPAIDLAVRHSSGHNFDARVYLCNRPTHGGGLKRQLDKVLQSMDGRGGFMFRASELPPNKKNQTAQAFRKFRDGGGRLLLVPVLEWRRMVAAREFHAHHRYDPGFSRWFEQSKLLSGLVPVVQLLRLDLIGRPLPRATGTHGDGNGNGNATGMACTALRPGGDPGEPNLAEPVPGPVPPLLFPEGAALSSAPGTDWTGPGSTSNESVAASDDALPLAVILDETRDHAKSIYAGREIGGRSLPITLNKNVLKRHAAVLGGSGSGKTTLALSLIEQLLLRGTPAVLIDRKGDLCSYANPDLWRAHGDENQESGNERAQLADAIDVAVYTPGRALGRPISITLLPTGISELPEHEQQLLANLSAAAMGDMLHLKNSATHQKLSGTLSVALKLLGSRSRSEVTLGDLIHLLEDEDPELTDLTQRMDPSGKLRRDLVAQLDSLRHRNSALFEGGGESLRMEALLGIGPYARP